MHGVMIQTAVWPYQQISLQLYQTGSLVFLKAANLKVKHRCCSGQWPFPNGVWRSHHQNHTQTLHQQLMNEEPMRADQIPLLSNSTGPASKLIQGHQQQFTLHGKHLCQTSPLSPKIKCGGIALAIGCVTDFQVW